MPDPKHGTSGGVDLSEERVHELADEAERGYDTRWLRTRARRGRPPLGQEPATVFHVRLEPSLRAALVRRADEEATTPSDLVRRALRDFLGVNRVKQDSPADEPLRRREVVPNPSGGWDVVSSQGERASSHHATQKDAIQRARRVLQEKGGGELRIKGRDGRVRDQTMISGDKRTRRSDG